MIVSEMGSPIIFSAQNFRQKSQIRMVNRSDTEILNTSTNGYVTAKHHVETVFYNILQVVRMGNNHITLLLSCTMRSKLCIYDYFPQL